MSTGLFFCMARLTQLERAQRDGLEPKLENG